MTHDELRKLAEAATPGPWDLGTKPQGKYTSGTIKKNGVEIAVTWAADWNDDYDAGSLPYKENAAYIAAANPKTVLELLDRIAELEGAEKRMAERACEVVDAYSDYDAQYCCDGRMCGCEGQTVHDMMKHFILAMAKP